MRAVSSGIPSVLLVSFPTALGLGWRELTVGVKCVDGFMRGKMLSDGGGAVGGNA